MERKELAAARDILQDAIAGVPKALWPRVLLSHALLQEGRDWPAAERALRDVLDIDLANPRATIIGDLRAVEQVTSQTYDCIILTQTLHVIDDMPAVVRECERLLKPGGVLLLSTPNLRSLNGLWNLLVHGRSYALKGDIYEEYENLEKVGHMVHVREYAPGDVRQLLKRVGFETEALVFWGRQPRMPAELLCRAMPQLRRFVTYVARAA